MTSSSRMEEMALLDKLSKARCEEVLNVVGPIPDELVKEYPGLIISFHQLTLARAVISALVSASAIVHPSIAAQHEDGAMGVELDSFLELLRKMAKMERFSTYIL